MISVLWVQYKEIICVPMGLPIIGVKSDDLREGMSDQLLEEDLTDVTFYKLSDLLPDCLHLQRDVHPGLDVDHQLLSLMRFNNFHDLMPTPLLPEPTTTPTTAPRRKSRPNRAPGGQPGKNRPHKQNRSKRQRMKKKFALS